MERILRAAVDAVDPALLVRRALARDTRPIAGREPIIRVVAAGKAAWPMARGLFAHGLPVGRTLIAGPGPPGGRPPDVEWIDAPHPAPDARSEAAGRRALALASDIGEGGGTLIVLLSGGASAMVAVPAAGLTVADKAAAAAALMTAGVPIAGLNCVRKHLSAIKGGRLAAAARWRTRTLALSDVHAPVEGDPAVIGSGPTSPDPTTFADALDVVVRSRAGVPPQVRSVLEAGARGEVPETPKPDDAASGRARFEIVGSRRTAMEGASSAAAALGYEVRVIDEATAGEARQAGLRFVERVRAWPGTAGRGLCVIASGETIVTVRGDGRGGRNQEFALGGVPALEALDADGITVVLGSAGTDGIDGPTDAAGGIADGTTGERARTAGLSIAEALRRNDAYPLLDALGDLIIWGPTGTNVGDVHVALVVEGARAGGP